MCSSDWHIVLIRAIHREDTEHTLKCILSLQTLNRHLVGMASFKRKNNYDSMKRSKFVCSKLKVIMTSFSVKFIHSLTRRLGITKIQDTFSSELYRWKVKKIPNWNHLVWWRSYFLLSYLSKCWNCISILLCELTQFALSHANFKQNFKHLCYCSGYTIILRYTIKLQDLNFAERFNLHDH